MAWWRSRRKETPPEGFGKEDSAGAGADREESTFAKLRRGLQKTASGLRQLIGLKRRIDEGLLEKLEIRLYEADFGPQLVPKLIGEVQHAWRSGALGEAREIGDFLSEKLLRCLQSSQSGLARESGGPTVVLVVGVNGTGKTTSIAKLGLWLSRQGNKVLLAAADTFRAAATEQLEIWADRLGLPVVTGKAKQDPASVAYQACEKAVTEAFDYVIVDTAGRLHTQANLMRELEKVRRVIAKRIEGAPQEILLVLDATVGQNAISQAESFHRALALTGLILAKLDGTAKGGIVVALNDRFGIPVKFVGVGEKAGDFAPFSGEKFVRALFQ